MGCVSSKKHIDPKTFKANIHTHPKSTGGLSGKYSPYCTDFIERKEKQSNLYYGKGPQYSGMII